jgi:cytochrome c oxidase subunit II
VSRQIELAEGCRLKAVSIGTASKESQCSISLLLPRRAILQASSAFGLKSLPSSVPHPAIRSPRSFRPLSSLQPGAYSFFFLFTSCTGIQSVLDTRGPQAARIAEVWWVVLGVSIFVFGAVVVLLAWALFRSGRGEPSDPPNLDLPPERGKTALVMIGVVATIAILFGVLIHSISIDRAIATFPREDMRTIEVIGHQWWWEVRYLDPIPDRIVETANEIHLPVGEPVKIKLTSRDVIHSFWVPNLHGKMDMVPGQTNYLWLQADEPGVFRGQCAEFCGLQHTFMGFIVVAQPAEEFAAWLEHQRQPAAPPATPIQARGQEVFLSTACTLCHSIRGTRALGQVAPDLTHVASRRTLAAATLPNSRGNLAAWIIDPQHIKPGNFMPPVPLAPEHLQPLLAYLESLH